eukprot:2718058-Pyramimonas_sp.AAC.1
MKPLARPLIISGGGRRRRKTSAIMLRTHLKNLGQVVDGRHAQAVKHLNSNILKNCERKCRHIRMPMPSNQRHG